MVAQRQICGDFLLQVLFLVWIAGIKLFESNDAPGHIASGFAHFTKATIFDVLFDCVPVFNGSLKKEEVKMLLEK